MNSPKIIFLFAVFSLIVTLTSFSLHAEELPREAPIAKIESKNPLSNLNKFLSKELLLGDQCPKNVFEKNSSYIRYLFRLLTLSYLHESLLDYQSVAEDMGLTPVECQIDWGQFISQCKSQTSDMQKFKERAFEYLRSIKEPLKKGNAALKLNELPTNSITKVRMNFEIKNQIFSKLSSSKKVPPFNKICGEDKQLFLEICSEQDRLYGISQESSYQQLILSSHTFRNINQEGKGEGCLQRFIHFYQHQEDYPEYLPDLTKKVSEVLKKRKDVQYLQGKLYLSGSLKEFDQKNLKDFLYAEVTKKAPPPPIEKKAPLPPQLPPPPPSPPQVVEIPQPLIEKKEVPSFSLVLKEEQKISSFETAYKKYRDQAPPFKAILVNMEEFMKESPISPEILEKIVPTITEYSSQEALKEMKSFDHLGEEQTPLSLLFLKILILNNDHHRLFNIRRILGNFLYIINDLENKERPVWIELKNDLTEKRWKIFISPPPLK